MKLLAAILVVLIAAQPVQAGFCALDASGDDDPHAAMQHGHATDDGGHSCCQTSGADENQDCGATMPCGSCAAGLLAPLFVPPTTTLWLSADYAVSSEGLVLPSHATPPFRPPISIA